MKKRTRNDQNEVQLSLLSYSNYAENIEIHHIDDTSNVKVQGTASCSLPVLDIAAFVKEKHFHNNIKRKSEILNKIIENARKIGW